MSSELKIMAKIERNSQKNAKIGSWVRIPLAPFLNRINEISTSAEDDMLKLKYHEEQKPLITNHSILLVNIIDMHAKNDHRDQFLDVMPGK